MREESRDMASRAPFDASAEEGLGLVELMVSIFILGVALIALAGVSMSSLHSLRITRDRERATNIASSTLEDVRARSWGDIALDATAADVAALSGCATNGETLVDDAVADPVAYTSTKDDYDITTVVSWVDDDCNSPDQANQLVKRVVTTVTWSDQNTERSVVEETLIAESERGLPVPEFQITPIEATIPFDYAEVIAGDASNPAKQCFRHQLRNLGADDRYDWELLKVVGEGTPPFKASGTARYKTPNGDWEVDAWFQYPAAASESDPADVTSGDAPVQFNDGTDANFRPEEDELVESREIANVWVCYYAIGGSGIADGTEFQTQLVFHSRFDENQTVNLFHTVTVGIEATPLYLFDQNDDQDHDRDTANNPNIEVYPPYPMGPEDGQNNSEENLGTTLHDWDQELDPDSQPGVWLTNDHDAVSSDVYTLAWHEQVASDTTLKPEMSLRLYVSTDAGLDGVIDPGDGDTYQQQEIDFRIQRLADDESTVLETIQTGRIVWTQNANGWLEQTVSIDAGSTTNFSADEFLRLEIRCDEDSDASCHVAYDNTTYASALTVTFA